MSDKIFTTAELIEYCKSFAWTRAIKQLHIHHTWKPEKKDYNGSNGQTLQDGMRAYHKSLGWSDIGQSLTLLPDGKWILGRDFNRDPASILGWNEGAIAIEMIGNFDVGHDLLLHDQAEALLDFSAFFLVLKSLNEGNLKFHRDNPEAGKTCPGTSINKDWYLSEVGGRIIKYRPKPEPVASPKAAMNIDEACVFLTGKAFSGGAGWLKKANADPKLADIFLAVANGWDTIKGTQYMDVILQNIIKNMKG